MEIIRHKWLKLTALLLCLTAPAGTVSGQQLTDTQAQLAIIHNFISHYVRWPGRYSLDQTKQIYVCSMGDDHLTEQLPLLEKASTEHIRVQVVRDPGDAELSLCHALYFAPSQKGTFEAKIKKMKDFPVLTISPIRQFTEKGGMVGLETEVEHQGNFEQRYVRYSLNSKALTSARLFIEPDALELASRVITE